MKFEIRNDGGGTRRAWAHFLELEMVPSIAWKRDKPGGGERRESERTTHHPCRRARAIFG